MKNKIKSIDIKDLFDYVSNLQEENKRLKEWKEDLLNENIELENIRKKAIELIDEPICYATDKMETPKIFIRRLKEVKDTLQGEDNE